MALATTQSSFVNRMIRAARLEVPLYEEVEADLNATSQALMVVVAVAVASGLGAAVGAPQYFVGRLVGGVLSGVIGWAVWSYVVYFVGTRFMGGTASYGELLRTLGFAQSPSVLLLFRFIPFLGGIVALVVYIWLIVAGFIAARQALDLDNMKTAITLVIGICALVVVVTLISLIFGTIFGLGAMFGALI